MKTIGYHARFERDYVTMDGSRDSGWVLSLDGRDLFIGSWVEAHELCLRLSGYPLLDWEKASGDPEDSSTWELL